MIKGISTTIFITLTFYGALTSAFGQAVFTLNTTGNKPLSKNSFQVSNIVEVTAPGKTNSYLLFKTENVLNKPDTLRLSIQSTNESIIPSGEILLVDSSNYYYDHPDSSFKVSLELTLNSGSCTQYELFEYDFMNAPPVVANQTFTIPENPHTLDTLGQLTASDPDSDNLWFELISTNPTFALTVEQHSGILTVADSTQFNHELTPSITSIIAVSDGWVQKEIEITVDVTDINEPPVLSTVDFEIEQLSAVGTLMGSVTAIDEDGDQLHYSIESGSLNAFFDINSSTGELILLQTLEQLPPPPHNLVIAVSDGEHAVLESFPIEVTRVLKNELETIQLYPNPVTDYLHFDTQLRSSFDLVSLADLSGKEISFNYRNQKLDFRQLPSGVYILTISVNNELETFKIIKH